MKFSELGLDDQILEAIGYMGFEDATPIQEQCIPQIINGKDVLAFAQTGTGKTAAFILPILHKLATQKHEGINTIVLVPTRELAIQIERQIQGFVYFIEADSCCIYGGGDGASFDQQKFALKRGTSVVVATPGKLISHLNLGYVNTDNVKHFILDEADRMLDMGFYEDIAKINNYLPKQKQTLFFSATMAPKIKQLAGSLLQDPFQVSLAISKPAAGVTQGAFLAFDAQKEKLLESVIADKEKLESIIIFCSKKAQVNNLHRSLRNKKYNVAYISSDLEQDKREEVLQAFRSKSTRILIGTDVISRGIDIKDINMVINYDVPDDAEDYVHRVGRTARASTTGIAYTFINEQDIPKFQRIEKLIETDIEKLSLPAELGTGPEWRKFSSRNQMNARGKSGSHGQKKFHKKRRPNHQNKPKQVNGGGNNSGNS